MHHRATIKTGTHDALPVNILCVCGTGGDFGSKEEAAQWMAYNHFRTLGGINTAEIVDTIPEPEKVEEFPIYPQPEEEPAAVVADEVEAAAAEVPSDTP